MEYLLHVPAKNDSTAQNILTITNSIIIIYYTAPCIQIIEALTCIRINYFN